LTYLKTEIMGVDLESELAFNVGQAFAQPAGSD